MYWALKGYMYLALKGYMYWALKGYMYWALKGYPYNRWASGRPAKQDLPDCHD